MSAHRLFRFPKPAWINSANARTAGVYTAGALVGILFAVRTSYSTGVDCWNS